jgi:hypothetical protein
MYCKVHNAKYAPLPLPRTLGKGKINRSLVSKNVSLSEYCFYFYLNKLTVNYLFGTDIVVHI